MGCHCQGRPVPSVHTRMASRTPTSPHPHSPLPPLPGQSRPPSPPHPSRPALTGNILVYLRQSAEPRPCPEDNSRISLYGIDQEAHIWPLIPHLHSARGAGPPLPKVPSHPAQSAQSSQPAVCPGMEAPPLLGAGGGAPGGGSSPVSSFTGCFCWEPVRPLRWVGPKARARGWGTGSRGASRMGIEGGGLRRGSWAPWTLRELGSTLHHRQARPAQGLLEHTYGTGVAHGCHCPCDSGSLKPLNELSSHVGILCGCMWVTRSKA